MTPPHCQERMWRRPRGCYKRIRFSCDGAADSHSSVTVYVVVYAEAMRRTNIYLSEAEQAALDARAVVEGSSRSDVVRAIVDRELNLATDDALDDALADAAPELAQRARTLSRQDPDLRSS
jgi:hypothetical protein